MYHIGKSESELVVPPFDGKVKIDRFQCSFKIMSSSSERVVCIYMVNVCMCVGFVCVPITFSLINVQLISNFFRKKFVIRSVKMYIPRIFIF